MTRQKYPDDYCPICGGLLSLFATHRCNKDLLDLLERLYTIRDRKQNTGKVPTFDERLTDGCLIHRMGEL